MRIGGIGQSTVEDKSTTFIASAFLSTLVSHIATEKAVAEGHLQADTHIALLRTSPAPSEYVIAKFKSSSSASESRAGHKRMETVPYI